MKFLRSLIALYMITFNRVLQTCLIIFNCESINFNDKTISIMTNYPAIWCEGDEYRNLLIPSIIIFIIYVIVIPIVLLYFIRLIIY